jgi:hypothetical protein
MRANAGWLRRDSRAISASSSSARLSQPNEIQITEDKRNGQETPPGNPKCHLMEGEDWCPTTIRLQTSWKA